MADDIIFASYPVFAVAPGGVGGLDRDVAAKELDDIFDRFGETVAVRGTYSTVGFSGSADLMFWLTSTSIDDLQSVVARIRQSQLGSGLQQRELFLGVTRPAEFAKDHQPAFVKGEEPKRFMTVYPFVRAPEWYLLDPQERGNLLREHGTAGREFPDVLANTTSAFGLGDYEWILCFEADSPDRLVDLIRRLRATEARRFTKLEIPFFTGTRKPIAEVIGDLP